MPKCLLVIDALPTNRIRLSAAFEAAQYAVVTASSATVAAERAPGEPDLVVLGIGTEDPGEAIAKVRAAGFSDTIPLLCIDSDVSPTRRLRALRAGARDVLQKALPDALLLARLRGLIREGEAELECERRRLTASSFGFAEAQVEFTGPAHVACVHAGDRTLALPQVLGASLPLRFEALGLDDAMHGEDAVSVPDAYLIVTGPDDTVLETLLPELRDRSHSRHSAVIVLHPADQPELAIRALNLGASDITADNASGEELGIRIDNMLRRKRLRDTLRKTDEQSYRLAATDPLTGLYNRRYAEAYLADLIMREEDHERGYVMMMVDLDHFKSVNDRFGHAAGDQVLCAVAERIRDNLRACDLISRHGGEEFLVVLPDTGSAEAERTSERLRSAVSGSPVLLDDGRTIAITASIGVAFGQGREISAFSVKTGTLGQVERPRSSSLQLVFDAADAALYRAKTNGRNRVEFSAA